MTATYAFLGQDPDDPRVRLALEKDPILCGSCGSRMELKLGGETALQFRCTECPDYFYAASRHLMACGTYGVRDDDTERALDILLAAGSGWRSVR